ncbi:TetR/AcrR family transcriptional regulator [Ktedonospora formicarum]|uniref:TetR family transcriptional regulator n=1 Tax=Ktedonospora formicarum TaxID=2778364 RepID=A0A8J3I6I9_9CHLR|nr:TetR/AcrR family transcriptional regulator [Ktedonospora formicarum]GHO46773.1 TetR family transcriptional regulator [Ktedonospora formicarum]
MNGYERRSQKKRDAILDAAQKLFLERGLQDVHVSEIAKEANVSQVTIYHYFGTKQALALEMLKRYMNRAMDEAEQLLARDIPFREKLALLFMEQGELANQFSDTFMRSIAWDDPEIQAFYQAYANERTIPFFRTFVEKGKREGAIESHLSFEAVVAYLSQFRQLFSQPDFLKTSRKYKEDLGHLFYYGLLGK